MKIGVLHPFERKTKKRKHMERKCETGEMPFACEGISVNIRWTAETVAMIFAGGKCHYTDGLYSISVAEFSFRGVAVDDENNFIGSCLHVF